MKTTNLTLIGLGLVGACAAPLAQAVSWDVGNTKVTLGGYVKLDAMVTRYDARPGTSGDALGVLGRDYYVGPLGVPLDDGGDDVTVFDAHAKQTRLILKTATALNNGQQLGTYVEADFLNSDAGNESISNSYQLRLRQAYLTYGNWLFGQAWSTFQNVAALPETVDFIGPTESTVFIRQPMIRYTRGPWQIALENPETRLSGDATTDDNSTPDLALRMNLMSSDSTTLVLTGLLRSLESQDQPGTNDRNLGGGLSLSGIHKIGRDDVKFMLTAGSGLGRYLGVLANPDANVDAGGEIDPIDSVAAYVAYRHAWSEKARSSVVLGMFDGDGAIESASSVHVNYMYSPVSTLTFGVEYLRADREDADGREGSFDRLQFGALLKF